jgi:GntR family histidine utilization transcriptional repressor
VVAHPQVHSAVLEIPDLAQTIEARGEAYRWMRTNRHQLVDTSGPGLCIEGVHFAGGEPLAIERRLLWLATVPQAVSESFLEEAPGTWLLRHIPWTSARHQIRAVEASKREAEVLGLRSRAACLEIQRTTWRGGTMVTKVRQLFRGDRYDLVAEFKPGTPM